MGRVLGVVTSFRLLIMGNLRLAYMKQKQSTAAVTATAREA